MWDLVPRPGIEHAPLCIEAQNLNHWTARDISQFPCCWIFSPLLPCLCLFSCALASAPLALGKQCPVLFSVLSSVSSLGSLGARIGTIWAWASAAAGETLRAAHPRASQGSCNSCDDLSCFFLMKQGRWVGCTGWKERSSFRAVNTERSRARQTQSKLDALGPQSVPWNDLQASRSLVRASALWSVISDRTPWLSSSSPVLHKTRAKAQRAHRAPGAPLSGEPLTRLFVMWAHRTAAAAGPLLLSVPTPTSPRGQKYPQRAPRRT